MKQLIEGSTKLIEHTDLIPTKRMKVFYNPAKEHDRSLNIKVAKQLKVKTMLDLLAGSGARGIRLMNEAGVKAVFNDLNPLAVKLIKKNLKLNKLKAAVHNKDSNSLCFELDKGFDFVDIDPFGSPNPYLESGLRRVNRHGLLAVTATDTAALVGTYPRTTLRKYHSSVVRHPFMKETGLRILVKQVIEKGAEHEAALKPVLCYSMRHYFRAYFKKDLGSNRCDQLVKEVKCLYYCPACGHRGFEPCNHKPVKLGPLYTGSINSLKIKDDFVQGLVAEDSYPAWHYNTTELTRLFKMKQEPPANAIIQSFKGIKVHYGPKTFKTNQEIKKGITGFKKYLLK